MAGDEQDSTCSDIFTRSNQGEHQVSAMKFLDSMAVGRLVYLHPFFVKVYIHSPSHFCCRAQTAVLTLTTALQYYNKARGMQYIVFSCSRKY